MDVIALTEYGIETFGHVQAARYYQALTNTLELLSEMSGLGRRVPELGIQFRRFEHGRHSIFYVAHDDHVEIARIIENSREMWRQFHPRTTMDS